MMERVRRTEISEGSQAPMDRLRALVELPESSSDDQVIAHTAVLIKTLRERLHAAEMARFLQRR